jgi:tRNA A-37 threonylcarbamoyl transferase component Bud32
MPALQADRAGNADVLAALRRMGLILPGETPRVTPLSGGVSSDILRVDLTPGPVCIKRALSRLKVQADWHAPVERNRWEVEWLRVAGSIVPGATPSVLAEDASCGMFVMEYLEPALNPVWKSQLRDGVVDAGFAAEVGRRIAMIHAHTSRRDELAARFATDHIFFPIRLEPYLLASARVHADCSRPLEALVQATSSTKLALVHGDVSPKNILCGANGPVFLDAECAWFGDPAFDLAFSLNHLLLKCLWHPQWHDRYLACFDALAQAYLQNVTWEAAADVEARTARLLPGLLLARVDGKSPVEYITANWQRYAVRSVARRYLLAPVGYLKDIRSAWRDEVAGCSPTPSTPGNA